MPRWNPTHLFRRFFKSYFEDCPSGKKRVYWNPEDAFPFAVTGFQANLSGNIGTDVLQGVRIDAKYKKSVQTLLVQLNTLNGELPLLFYAAYVIYQADPCNNSDHLKSQIKSIIEEYQRLKSAKVAIDGYVDMISNGADPSLLSHALIDLTNDLRLPNMQAALNAANKLREG